MLSICLWEQRESNPRPSACKADALNQLSYAPFFSFLFQSTLLSFHSFSLYLTKINFEMSLIYPLPITASNFIHATVT